MVRAHPPARPSSRAASLLRCRFVTSMWRTDDNVARRVAIGRTGAGPAPGMTKAPRSKRPRGLRYDRRLRASGWAGDERRSDDAAWLRHPAIRRAGPLRAGPLQSTFRSVAAPASSSAGRAGFPARSGCPFSGRPVLEHPSPPSVRRPEGPLLSCGSRSVEVDVRFLVLSPSGAQELLEAFFIHRLLHSYIHRLACGNTR